MEPTEQVNHGSHKTVIIASIAAVMVLVAVTYGIFLVRQAEKPATAVEVEQTATSGDGVIVGEDAEASGGKYIQFEPKQ